MSYTKKILLMTVLALQPMFTTVLVLDRNHSLAAEVTLLDGISQQRALSLSAACTEGGAQKALQQVGAANREALKHRETEQLQRVQAGGEGMAEQVRRSSRVLYWVIVGQLGSLLAGLMLLRPSAKRQEPEQP